MGCEIYCLNGNKRGSSKALQKSMNRARNNGIYAAETILKQRTKDVRCSKGTLSYDFVLIIDVWGILFIGESLVSNEMERLFAEVNFW